MLALFAANVRVGKARVARHVDLEEVLVDRRVGGIGIGGILVIIGIILVILGYTILGIIVALIGLIAFGGFARGRWY